MVRRPSLGPVRRLFHDSSATNGDGVVVTTTLNGSGGDSGDGVSPVRMRRKSAETNHSRQSSRVNEILTKAANSFPSRNGGSGSGNAGGSTEMDMNLIQDPSPYSSVETDLGYTNGACTALKSLPRSSDGPTGKLYRNVTSFSQHDSPIDTIVFSSPNHGGAHTVASDDANQPIVIQMPSHLVTTSTSTDDFTYALEHVL